jgi:polyhydroxyalkanoate synthesis repressor PhaR
MKSPAAHASRNNGEPQTLDIRKYPNRRYYDTTHSRHTSLAQIHKLILEGYNFRIVDVQTGDEITPQILTQILLEFEPAKLSVFSNELLTRAIRVSDSLLNDFVDRYFRQAFEVFCTSQKQFDGMLREAHQLTTALQPANWLRGLFPSWGSPGAAPAPSSPPPVPEDKEAASLAVRKEIAALRKEISTLKAQVKKKPAPPVKRKKARGPSNPAGTTRK